MSIIAKVIRATSLVAVMLFLAGIEPARAQHEGHQPTVPAAAVDVSGSVLCVDGPALPGAVVQLFRNVGQKEQLQASALSDEAGRFRLRASAGTYTLRITFLGHASSTQVVEIEPGARAITLGGLRLQIAAVEMEAIVASVEQDRIRMQAGATVFDAKRSGASAGGSVADVLRTVPNLELDAEGRVSLRGSTSVLVLINGRRTVLKDDALIAFLKQMPASALDKVEVSTSASARQDAEGFAGIVNLQFNTGTAAQHETGYGFAISGATAGQLMATVSANGASALNSWDAMYAASSMSPQTYSHTMRDNYLAPEALRTSHQESNADARHVLHSMSAGGVLGLGGNSSLNGRVAYSWMKGTFDNTTDFADIAVTGARSADALTASHLEHTIPALDVSLGWAFRRPTASHLRLTSELRYAHGTERFAGSYRDSSRVQFLATDMDFLRSELVWQNDLAVDLRGLRLEAGHKTQRRELDAGFDAMRLDEMARSHLNFVETVNALYTSLSWVVGPVFVQGGVRAEATANSLALTGQPEREQSDVRLFPSVAVHWPHDREAVTQFQFAFGRRIQRPDAASLNPFSMGEDDMNSFIGNPMLRPEITDQVELGVVHRLETVTIQATPYLRATHDPIRPIKAVTASGQATTTLQNLHRSRAGGVDVGASARVHERVTAIFSSNLFYSVTEGQSLRADGLYFNLRGSLDVKMSANTTAQLYAYRRSAQPIEQGEILPAVNSELAVTRRFGADRRGSLTLRVSDPFDSNKLAFHLDDATFSQHSERKITSRMMSVFLSWALGGARTEEQNRPAEEPPVRIF